MVKASASDVEGATANADIRRPLHNQESIHTFIVSVADAQMLTPGVADSGASGTATGTTSGHGCSS